MCTNILIATLQRRPTGKKKELMLKWDLQSMFQLTWNLDTKKNDGKHQTEKMITFFIQTEKDKLIRLCFFGSIVFTSAP